MKRDSYDGCVGRVFLRLVFGVCLAWGLVVTGVVAQEGEGEQETGLAGVWTWRIDLPAGGRLEAWMQLQAEADRERGGFKGSYGSEDRAIDLEGLRLTPGAKFEFEAETSIDGAPVPVSYSGVLDGAKITGTATFELAGEEQAWGWEAERVSTLTDVSGTWSWTIEMNDGRRFEPELRLEQRGDVVTGVLAWSSDNARPISAGRVEGDQVVFEVVRERNGKRRVSRFEGGVNGKVMEGKVKSTWGEEERVYDLRAVRRVER